MDDLPRALAELGFMRSFPTVVLVGGADMLTPADLERLSRCSTSWLG
jgi:hypothetical protein